MSTERINGSADLVIVGGAGSAEDAAATEGVIKSEQVKIEPMIRFFRSLETLAW